MLKPQIVCHRGMWTTQNEQNTVEACFKAVESGFGVEIDLRVVDGELSMIHDHGDFEESRKFENLLRNLEKHSLKETLFLDIKEMGMGEKVQSLLHRYGYNNYFLFNQTTPDFIAQSRIGLKSLTRISEYEQLNENIKPLAQGVCLDLFEESSSLSNYISMASFKDILLISPELHKRQHHSFWKTLKNLEYPSQIFLCTDYPNEARKFFYE